MSEELAVNVVYTIHAWVFAAALLYATSRIWSYIKENTSRNAELLAIAFAVCLVFGVLSCIFGVMGYMTCIVDIIRSLYHVP